MVNLGQYRFLHSGLRIDAFILDALLWVNKFKLEIRLSQAEFYKISTQVHEPLKINSFIPYFLALLFLSSFNDKYRQLFPGSAEGKRANRLYFNVE